MRFFDSEIVREELSEINRLQTSIYGKMFGFDIPILAKKRELLALKSRGYLSEEDEQNIRVLETEIQDLVKQARLMMRRKNEAERDSSFQPAAGGYMKPMKK